MNLTIHDVGHGQCISLIHQNGNVMLLDCGHKEGSRPSEFLPQMGVKSVEYFFVTNYDEDHLSDLPNLRRKLKIQTLFRNRTISAEQLRELKRQAGPITDAMESMIQMTSEYNFEQFPPPQEFPGVEYRLFYNEYVTEFKDTNNISLVVFLTINNEKKFIITGDLETAGWDALLRRSDFRSELASVNVFLASHHGRESGYHADVFDYCKPEVVVISDDEIKYETQEMTRRYADHARGIQFRGETRRVFSTRSDGSIYWSF